MSQPSEPVLIALSEYTPPPDHWIDTLLAQLAANDAHLRATAIDLLGKQNTKASDVNAWARIVGKMTDDPDDRVRGAAIWALQHANGLAYAGLDGVLHAVATEKDNDNRERAAEAVGDIGDASFAIGSDIKKSMARAALPVLEKTIASDPSDKVRQNAVRSLNKLDLEPSVVLPILAKTAVESKDWVRTQALQSLRNRGKDAAPVAETIRPLLNNSDPMVKKEVQAALDAMKSSYSGNKSVAQTAASDPAAREKGLAFLREHNLKYEEGDFYRALMEINAPAVTAFLDAGMSPNLRFANSYGDPVLRVVVDSMEGCNPGVRPTAAETKSLVKMLIARGATAKIADDRGNTPLMSAAEKCDAEIVKMLLKAGADVNAKNGSGLTAFEFALWNGNDGASAIAAAGYRLPPEKAKMYRESYAKKPKTLELIKLATK